MASIALGRTLFAAAGLTLAGIPVAAAPAGSVIPADPIVGETVLISFTICSGSSPTWFGPPTVRVDGSTITLSAQYQGSDFSVPSCAQATGAANGLAAGHYDVVFAPAPPIGNLSPSYAIGSVTVSDAQRVRPQYTRLDGNWFDPDAPGSGVNVVQGDSGALFATVLTFDQYTLLPTWYVMSSGVWLTPTRFRGALYAPIGSPARVAWDASQLHVIPFGLLTLDFSGASDAAFQVQPMGWPSQSKLVHRFQF